jgi:hypothetical protein
VGFLFDKPAVVVASVRYLGAVHFRAEAFTNDEPAAEQLTAQLNTVLGIFHSSEVSASGQTPDPDIRKALDSLKVEQHKDRAVMTATLPVELIRKMVAAAPSEVAPNPSGK